MANELEKIFKDNPELLETKEVKELVAYTRDQHAKYGRLLNEFRTKVHTVTDIVFNSELCVIGGATHKDALIKIAEII